MNERIKQLAVQARNYALDEKRIYERVHNTEQCMEVYREGYNEKFAELLVKECVNICNTTTDKGYLNGVMAGHKIKEHFGIKE